MNDYSGLTEQVMNNCACALSLHSIGIRDGFVLNRTPCQEFTPEYISENASTGSLFRSSNIDPNDPKHGNLKQPDRLNQRKKEFSDGRQLDCIPLITSKPCHVWCRIRLCSPMVPSESKFAGLYRRTNQGRHPCLPGTFRPTDKSINPQATEGCSGQRVQGCNPPSLHTQCLPQRLPLGMC